MRTTGCLSPRVFWPHAYLSHRRWNTVDQEWLAEQVYARNPPCGDRVEVRKILENTLLFDTEEAFFTQAEAIRQILAGRHRRWVSSRQSPMGERPTNAKYANRWVSAYTITRGAGRSAVLAEKYSATASPSSVAATLTSFGSPTLITDINRRSDPDTYSTTRTQWQSGRQFCRHTTHLPAEPSSPP